MCPVEINVQLIKIKGNVYFHSFSDHKRDKHHYEMNESKDINLKYIWCANCRHGGHVDHIVEWFQELAVCPVASCNCICLEYDHVLL
jgi:hypothetical protein